MQDKLCINIPGDDIEIGKRQTFNDYELIQEEYLRNFGMMDNVENPHSSEKSINQDVRQMKHYSQIQTETKTDKMSKLRREIEFLERGMQRLRTKLNRLQHDPKQTPSMSITGIRPKYLLILKIIMIENKLGFK